MSFERASAVSSLDFDRSDDTQFPRSAEVRTEGIVQKAISRDVHSVRPNDLELDSPAIETDVAREDFEWRRRLIIPTLNGPIANEVITKKWEGVVESVEREGDYFVAKLLDLSADTHLATDVAEFSISQLSRGDRELLRPGAVFYWVIGNRTQPYGTVENINRIAFRRIPAWTKSEIEASNQRAKRISDAVKWD